MSGRRKPTSTSSFGVSRREGHDASGFYGRFTPPELSRDSDIDLRKAIDGIFCGDARHMDAVPDRSVALVVTSPPYFAGKEYEEALGEGHVPRTYLEFLQMLEDVFAECVRKLEPGGRIAVNVANLGRKPYRSLSADVVTILQDKLRLLLRGEVIWQKARGTTGSCAWGSFQRPANPVLRDLTERVVIASKGRFDRALSARERDRRGLPSAASLSRDEFMEATTDVWEIPAESATRVGHPAPFPVALPERLIHLYTYYGDLVLDPFMGSGSTAVAAVRTGRHYVGYDTDDAYVARAIERVRHEAGAEPGLPMLPAVRAAAGDEEPAARALREGRRAREIADAILRACGFGQLAANHRVAQGLTVNLLAHDGEGKRWFFDVAGAYTSSRPGLRRADMLWKALGKAAVVHEVEPKVPFVLLTTDVPASGSAGDVALQAMRGRDKPLYDVVRMLDPDDQRRLREMAAPPRSPRSPREKRR